MKRRDPIFGVWSSMRQRCANPRDKSFARYGGRGITVCERWCNSFEAFRHDMGPRPEGASIDRINNDGNYEPGNCRWATLIQQNRNSRANTKVTLNGETFCIAEWIERRGLKECTVYARLSRGWTNERALTQATRRYGVPAQ